MADYIQWLRSKIGSMKIPVVFACAIVLNEEGQILWQQRSDFGWWGLLGGVVELNESLEEALNREIFEETGLFVKRERLLGIYSSPNFDVEYPNGDQVQQITFTFVCRVIGGKEQIDSVETLALVWKSETNLPKTSPWYQAMLDDYLKKSDIVHFQHARGLGRPSELPLYKTLRQYIGQAAYIAPGTGAIIFNEKGYVLLQLRSDNRQWSIPGGSLELGEQIDQAVCQEVWEETGLEVEIERISGIYSDKRFFFTYPNGDQLKVIAVVFVCRVTGGILQADGDESLELRYFDPEDLPPMPPRIQDIIQDALTQPKELPIT